MAKIDMFCPFSEDLCQECPQYRGRHYYLCFYNRYRGYIGESKAENTKKPAFLKQGKKFEIPPPLKPSPTWLAFNDYPDRGKK